MGARFMDDSLAIYLHDHLAGAALAVDMLEAMRDRQKGETLGDFAVVLLVEIEADRSVLKGLADGVGDGSSQLKEASAWLSEKVSRFKLGCGLHSLGTFEALEFLALGIMGKLSLWTALAAVAPLDERLQTMDFDRLIALSSVFVLSMRRLKVGASQRQRSHYQR
jgi:hypothetical protein